MKNKLFKNFLLVGWAFLIFLGSSLPPTKAANDSLLDFLIHKSAHLFEYAILYVLYYYNASSDFWQEKGKDVFQAFIFVLVFGAFDEYHQSFVPGRTSKVRDVIIDLVGGFLGYLIWRFLRQKMLKKQKN